MSLAELDDVVIRKLVEDKYIELGHRLGWNVLYCPVAVRKRARFATIGLNPGGGREGDGVWDSRRQFSDEAGNSYEVQDWGAGVGQAPLQLQVRRLAEILKTAPGELLSANVVPFRSPSWRALIEPKQSLEFGLSLLPWLLGSRTLRLVVMFGLGATEHHVANALGAANSGEMFTGWGATKARFYQSPRLALVGLPHLSRFRLFGRAQAAALEHRIHDLAQAG